MWLASQVAVLLFSGTLSAMAPLEILSVQAGRCVDTPEIDVYGGACENRIEVAVTEASEGQAESVSTSASGSPLRLVQRREMCGDWIVPVGGSAGEGVLSWPGEIPACVEPFEVVEDFCSAGVEVLAPLWVSWLVDEEAVTYGPWQMVSGYECAGDPLPAAIAQAWRQMTITPQTVAVLPEGPWAVATVGVAANLDDSAQTSTVTVLGTDVTLRATPISSEWTVTDVVTGDSWPGVFDTASANGGEVMVFERRQQRVQLGVTTTWEGHYSLNGGATWVPAPGTATTTSDPLSVHVYHPRARLVNCDTTGNCMGGGVSSNPFTLTDPDADGIDNYQIPDHEIGAYLESRDNDRAWHGTE